MSSADAAAGLGRRAGTVSPYDQDQGKPSRAQIGIWARFRGTQSSGEEAGLAAGTYLPRVTPLQSGLVVLVWGTAGFSLVLLCWIFPVSWILSLSRNIFIIEV